MLAAAFAVLVSGAGCHAPAPAAAPASASNDTVSAVALCPDTMQGEGDQRFALSGLSIMRDENGAGWKNFPPTGEASRKMWTLPQDSNTQYRAACEYGDEIIGVAVNARFRRCWLEVGADAVKAWCDGAG